MCVVPYWGTVEQRKATAVTALEVSLPDARCLRNMIASVARNIANSVIISVTEVRVPGYKVNSHTRMEHHINDEIIHFV